MGKPGARQAILDTAARLFARDGFDAVSLRKINTEAGYSVAALHYHFRTKDVLIRELFEERRDSVMKRRKALLSSMAQRRPISLLSITEVLVLPFAELLLEDPEQGLISIKLFFRLYVEMRDEEEVKRETEAGFRMFGQLLQEVLPEVNEKTMMRRWMLATELTFQALANTESLLRTEGKKLRREDVELYTAQLIDFIAGGLAASDQTAITRTVRDVPHRGQQSR